MALRSPQAKSASLLRHAKQDFRDDEEVVLAAVAWPAPNRRSESVKTARVELRRGTTASAGCSEWLRSTVCKPGQGKLHHDA